MLRKSYLCQGNKNVCSEKDPTMNSIRKIGHRIFLFLAGSVIQSVELSAQTDLWQPEAEAPESRIVWKGDTVEIFAPKGLTLWYKEKISGNVVIRYDACIVNTGKAGERTSDLNCFWMASDPQAKDIWERMAERQGIFNRCYALRMYYMGYGGNYNTTTRFRRYDGNERGIREPEFRPGILQEYTDSAHLLEPNRWYHIRLECINGKVRYFINGTCLVDYTDAHPLTSGWFGFRTTFAHALLTNFQVLQKP